MAVENFFLANFMAQLKGVVHQNQFLVEIMLPQALSNQIAGPGNGENLSFEDLVRFTVKAASIPESNLGTINVNFRGAPFKIPGDRTFDSWQSTVINDPGFTVRNALEQWSDMCNGNVNRDQVEVSNQLDLMGSAVVHQLDRSGNILKSYVVTGIWPKNVGSIDLDWDNTDSYETYAVTWEYQWWESDKTTRNNTQADQYGESGGLRIS